MYADKDRQREANRKHAKAYRDRKGMTQGMTEKVPDRIIPDKYLLKEADMTPERVFVGRSTANHHPTCRCFVCKPPEGK
jgi:hypothetical protein